MLDVQSIAYTSSADPDAPDQSRSLSRAEYDELVAQGRFDDQRVELLRGALITMSPQGPRHAHVSWRISATLSRALDQRAMVRGHSPLALSDDSEPEPDVAVVPLGDYSQAHPQEAFLVIEVADTSLSRDRNTKAPLYAECGILEYWIINMAERVIEVHRDPDDRARYRNVTTAGPDDTLSIAAFPDVELRVADLLS